MANSQTWPQAECSGPSVDGPERLTEPNSIELKSSEPKLTKPESINKPQTPRPRYSFSANRTQGRHRVRYVETSQASEQCTLCELAQH
ncbi:hypothetical protein [Shewanella sp. cp20]|uniref:hypothetical protein n=1 Tax=Shewanella sp. cp20 TaxID=1521167 RepID=UPI001269BD2B|nr:hypothetical protein [Shewanella sp. cp20]